MGTLNDLLMDNGILGVVPGTQEQRCRKCNYEFLEQLMWCPECRNQRPSRCVKIGHASLHPGDTLEQSSEKEHGYSMERLRAGERPKEHLVFYPSLKVKQVKLLARGGYSDIHQHFTGWNNITEDNNLDFVPKGNIK